MLLALRQEMAPMLLGRCAKPSPVRRNWVWVSVATPAVLACLCYMYKERSVALQWGIWATYVGCCFVAVLFALPLFFFDLHILCFSHRVEGYGNRLEHGQQDYRSLD